MPDTSTSEGTSIPGTPAWQYVESRIREIMRRYDFEEVRTPILEETELIARGVGAQTDIVSKEMFVVERGDSSYVLRPEVTAPVVRAYLQHHLAQRGGVQKLYYIGPCFRAESPHTGRYRQFHQFGCEVLGADDARADAEMISLMIAIYREFGITNTRLRINSLGGPETRTAYREALRSYLQPHAEELTETSRKRLATNPLRILDTKDERDRRRLACGPQLADHLDEVDRLHYDQVQRYLDDLGVAFVEDPYLVRGLDYYGRTTFELESDDLGAQSALAGGGRYDILATGLGAKQPVPAIGFAAGMGRLFLAMSAAGSELAGGPVPDAFLVLLGVGSAAWNCSFWRCRPRAWNCRAATCPPPSLLRWVMMRRTGCSGKRNDYAKSGSTSGST